MMEMTKWDAERMFKLYVLDYLVKRNKLQTAAIFAMEADVEMCRPAIDSPVSFLYEWWTVFYDAYISRQNCLEASSEQAQNKGKQIILYDTCDDQLQQPKSDIGPEKPVQKGNQIIGYDTHDDQFRLLKPDIGPEKPVQKGKQIIGYDTHDDQFRLLKPDIGPEKPVQKDKQMIGYDTRDDQFQLSKSDIGPEKPVQFPFVSDIAKLLGQPELEQLAYVPGVLCSSSQFPVTDFCKSSNSWINKDPQQLPQAQLQSDQLGGNILNLGGTANDSAFGASGAMLGNCASKNLDLQNAVNYTPLHGWPLHGAGQTPTSMQMEVMPLYSHGLGYLPPIQPPTLQRLQELFPQFMGHTAGCGTSALPGNSFDLSNINPTLLQNGLGGSIGQINGSNDLSSFQYYLLGLWSTK